MLFSAIFHSFSCYSSNTSIWLAKLDYAGISIMIVGSYIPPIFYIFKCHEFWRIFYISAISLFGVIGLIVSSANIFSTPKFRTVRAVFYVVFGLSAVVPVPHLMFMTSFEFVFPIAWREALLGALYIFGAFVYSIRFPECKFPGRFDYLHSHFLWHIFTMVAALWDYFVCVYCFYYEQTFTCPI